MVKVGKPQFDSPSPDDDGGQESSTVARERPTIEDAIGIARGYLRSGVLLVVHMTVSVIATWLLAGSPRFSTLASILNAGVIFGQVTLLGLWVGCGSSHILFRLFSLPVVCAGLAFLITGMADLPKPESLPLFRSVFFRLVIPAAIVAIVGFALRCKLVVRRESCGLRPDQQSWNFSVGQLLMLTGLVAGVLALGRVLANDNSIQGRFNTMIFAQCVVMIPVGFGALWASLGEGHNPLRVTLLLIAAVLLGIAAGFVHPRPPTVIVSHRVFVFTLCLTTLLQAFVVIVTLVVVRVNGFRLVPREAR